MRLYEYLEMTDGQEITVLDKDYDIEFYVEKEEPSKTDDWGRAMLDICKCLEIVKVCKNDTVETNLADVIEKNLDALDKADLFIDCDADSIMDDMDNILAGYVSESWLVKFSKVLMEGDSNGIEGSH